MPTDPQSSPVESVENWYESEITMIDISIVFIVVIA